MSGDDDSFTSQPNYYLQVKHENSWAEGFYNRKITEKRYGLM